MKAMTPTPKAQEQKAPSRRKRIPPPLADFDGNTAPAWYQPRSGRWSDNDWPDWVWRL